MHVLIVLLLITITPSTGRQYSNNNEQNYSERLQEPKLLIDHSKNRGFRETLQKLYSVDVTHKKDQTSTLHDDIRKQRAITRNQHAGGMISQMSLGLQAFSDKSMLYGPGPGINGGNGQGMGMSSMTSGNIPGSNYGGNGQGMGMSSMTSGNIPGSNYGGSGQGMGMSSMTSSNIPGSNYGGNGQGMGMSSMTSGNIPGSNYGGNGQGMGMSSMTSGNIPGSNYGGSGQGMGMSSGPFDNKGMSQSMFPAGLSNNNGGIPNGLSQGNSGISLFGGSSSMKGGSNRTPFNMAMLSMQSQAELSPSMGGAMSMNGGQPARGSSGNSLSKGTAESLEQKITFGDTASIQYVNGKIIVPRTWSLEKVRALKAKLEGGGVQEKHQVACPQASPNCPKSCVAFNNNGCPVCSCEEDICPVFPAGCRRGRVRINKDGCPVCVSNDKTQDWYNTIWNDEI